MSELVVAPSPEPMNFDRHPESLTNTDDDAVIDLEGIWKKFIFKHEIFLIFVPFYIVYVDYLVPFYQRQGFILDGNVLSAEATTVYEVLRSRDNISIHISSSIPATKYGYNVLPSAKSKVASYKLRSRKFETYAIDKASVTPHIKLRPKPVRQEVKSSGYMKSEGYFFGDSVMSISYYGHRIEAVYFHTEDRIEVRYNKDILLAEMFDNTKPKSTFELQKRETTTFRVYQGRVEKLAAECTANPVPLKSGILRKACNFEGTADDLKHIVMMMVFAADRRGYKKVYRRRHMWAYFLGVFVTAFLFIFPAVLLSTGSEKTSTATTA